MSEPRRVAHVITRMIVGGAQELVLSIIGGLDRRRFRSVLFTGTETGAEGSLLPRAEEMGIEVVRVPSLVRAPHPVKDLIAFRRLRDAFRRGSFEIVNSYTSKAGFVGTLAARRAGVPVVIYAPQGHIFASDGAIEGVSGRPIRQKIFFALRRWASRRADALVALHEGDRDEQVALGLAPASSFRVIPNGIDASRFPPPDGARRASIRSTLGLDGRSPVIGAVGRLCAEKGHDDLIDAMADLTRTHPSAVLLLAGDGPRRTVLEEKVTALGLEDSVRLLGLRRDIPEILSALDVFALSSRYESFGLVILEAMAASLPVVATRVGGIPFILRDGETGCLVPPREPREMAAKLRLLADRPELRAGMGRAGRERLLREYSLKAMVGRVESLYEDLLRRKGAAS